MFSLTAGLPRGPEADRAHLEALARARGDAEHEAIFSHLYACLSVLDDKSASLLSFNSLVIAVFAIFLTTQTGPSGLILMNAGMAAVLSSSMLLMSVVWIHWSDTADLANLQAHAVRLLGVRRSRTIRYRLAWYFSTGAILILAAYLVLRAVEHTPMAGGGA